MDSTDTETPETSEVTTPVDTTEVTVPRKRRTSKAEPEPAPDLDLDVPAEIELPEGTETDRYGFTIETR